MEQVFSFISNHWFLCLLFVIIVSLLAFIEMRERTQGIKKLSAAALVNFMNHENPIVVDLRTKEAFDSSHILGSQNFPYAEFEQRKADWQKLKTRPIVLVCPRGSQSAQIGARLQKLELTEIFILQGGINAWKTAGLPLKHK